MKKTDALIRITSLVVFIALAAYLIVYIVSRSSNSVQTALTVTATMSDSAPMSGLVIRNELVIRSGEPYISVTAADGSKVAAGETVAVAYSSEEALERATRLNALDREIDDVSAALNRSGTGLASGNLGESVYSAITGLSACIRGGNLSELDSRSSTLAGILFPSGNSDNTATDEYLAQLKKEYADLRKTAADDTEDITVGESGTFSNLVDGYEGVDPDYVKSLTPSELREIINADRMVDDTSIGKLITSYDWYYVGIIPWEDGQHLMEDTWVKLSFGRYYSGELDAQIEWVGRAENGQQVVLFRIEQGQADMLAVRAVSAELVYEEYTGLRVPLRGLYRYYAGYMSDEDGQALNEGDSVQLMLGEAKYDAFVSEIGSASRYGELPPGVESGSEQDTRPTHRLVVFCWPWDEDDGVPDSSSGGGAVAGADGVARPTVNFYDYRTVISGMEELDDADPAKWNIPDRLCVFTMTGMQAERKLVDLIYAGEEYCLLSSSGTDALREGNEVIVKATNLYNGRVFS